MKDEKKDGNCHTCVHKTHGNLLITVGIVAVVYAFINYLRVTIGYAWPPYAGWFIGGLLLIAIGWAKAYWKRRCC